METECIFFLSLFFGYVCVPGVSYVKRIISSIILLQFFKVPLVFRDIIEMCAQPLYISFPELFFFSSLGLLFLLFIRDFFFPTSDLFSLQGFFCQSPHPCQLSFLFFLLGFALVIFSLTLLFFTCTLFLLTAVFFILALSDLLDSIDH